MSGSSLFSVSGAARLQYLDTHIARTRAINESLAGMSIGDVPSVDAAADLSGVLVDAPETAHAVVREQYTADALPNSHAETGEIVLVSQADNTGGSDRISYSHEFMLVRDSLAPDSTIISVEPIEQGSDRYLNLPPGGLTEYAGGLSFDQPAQEFLRSIDDLGTMRWNRIVSVWQFLYSRYPRFTLRDGSAPCH